MKSAKRRAVVVAPPLEGPQTSREAYILTGEQEEMMNSRYETGIAAGLHAVHATIMGCTFDHVTFVGCTLQGAQLTDVRFDHCDLSNLSLAGASLFRVEFIGCKLLGADLTGARLSHVRLSQCNGQYLSLSESRLRTCLLEECDLRFADFTHCRPEPAAFDRCRLEEADCSHMPLAGIDLRTSHIAGLRLHPADLRGAVVSTVQLPDLAPLLGVVVED